MRPNDGHPAEGQPEGSQPFPTAAARRRGAGLTRVNRTTGWLAVGATAIAVGLGAEYAHVLPDTSSTPAATSSSTPGSSSSGSSDGQGSTTPSTSPTSGSSDSSDSGSDSQSGGLQAPQSTPTVPQQSTHSHTRSGGS